MRFTALLDVAVKLILWEGFAKIPALRSGGRHDWAILGVKPGARSKATLAMVVVEHDEQACWS